MIILTNFFTEMQRATFLSRTTTLLPPASPMSVWNLSRSQIHTSGWVLCTIQGLLSCLVPSIGFTLHHQMPCFKVLVIMFFQTPHNRVFPNSSILGMEITDIAFSMSIHAARLSIVCSLCLPLPHLPSSFPVLIWCSESSSEYVTNEGSLSFSYSIVQQPCLSHTFHNPYVCVYIYISLKKKNHSKRELNSYHWELVPWD